jgi:hypothetical protein
VIDVSLFRVGVEKKLSELFHRLEDMLAHAAGALDASNLETLDWKDMAQEFDQFGHHQVLNDNI